MTYKVLDQNNILDYFCSLDEFQDYANDDSLSVEEIGDGNLNFVFRIKSKEKNRSFIVKQAVPYLRCLGKEFPLKRDRMTYEIRSLRSYNIHTPEHIPTLYYTSETMSVIVMEDLDCHTVLRKGLISQHSYPKLNDQIATFLATNLFKHSSLYLDSDSKRALMDQFNGNAQMSHITEDFVFTFAFMDHPSNDGCALNNTLAQDLFNDTAFKQSVLALKYKFMTQTDTLLHGDLHTGSIMLNEHELFVIDSEFAFVGPFGFDLGALLANVIMSYISHTVLKTDDSYREYLYKTIYTIWEKFRLTFLQLWEKTQNSALIYDGFIDHKDLDEYRSDFMLNMLRDSVGYAGCKMARRMFGASGVEDIRGIKNDQQRHEAIGLVLRIAKLFVKSYETIHTMDEVMKIIDDTTSSKGKI